jgi:hypothetical protein
VRLSRLFRRKTVEPQHPAERSSTPEAAVRAVQGLPPTPDPVAPAAAVTPGLVAFDHRIHAFRGSDTTAVCGAGPRLSRVGGGFVAGAAGYCPECSA